jgi:hypothetical protein
MAITDIQRQKRNENRLSIYIDGKYAFSLDTIPSPRRLSISGTR